MRILLVEDEAELAQLIADGLIQRGFDVDTAMTLEEAKIYIVSNVYDLMVVDRNLPDGDGLTLINEMVQTRRSVPILILTARTKPEDRAFGLDSGADDYLIKPFAMVELIARVKTLLRRSMGGQGLSLRAGNVNFDTVNGTVTVNDKTCRLTKREHGLLETLLRRSGRLVSKETLEKSLYGMQEEGSRGAVDVAVHRLRKSLAGVDANISIHTMRGLGYVLEEPHE